MKIVSFKNTKFSNNFSIEDLSNILVPRITVSDVVESALVTWTYNKERNRVRAYGKKFIVNSEKAEELARKRDEIIHLLMNSPVNIFDFHSFLYKCGVRRIVVEVPSSSIIRKGVMRCYLHLYCPICNGFLLVSFYPKIISQVNLKKFTLQKETFLVYIKNLNLNFKAFLKEMIIAVFKAFCKKFNITDYFYSIKPAFNQSKLGKESLFDVFFICVEPFEINEMKAKEMYYYLLELFEKLGKKVDLDVKFDYDCYKINFFEKDLFDAFSIILYRIPVEIYYQMGIKLNYYQYLFSHYFSKVELFNKLHFLYSKKSMIEELFTDFKKEKFYYLLWNDLKREFA